MQRRFDLALFVALMATAFAMAGALAHALELPNKIALTREAYFTVQQIYRGWDRLGWLLLLELVSMLVVIHRAARGDRRALVLAVGALLCLLAAQAVFWIFTFPANRATDNWTMQPANWASLRVQWEYSHLAGAALQLLAMGLLAGLAVRREGRPGSTP